MTDQTGRPAREGAEAAVANETETPRESAEAAVANETETPREKLGQMEDKARSDTDLGEAIDRATAAVGQDDGKR